VVLDDWTGDKMRKEGNIGTKVKRRYVGWPFAIVNHLSQALEREEGEAYEQDNGLSHKIGDPEILERAGEEDEILEVGERCEINRDNRGQCGLFQSRRRQSAEKKRCAPVENHTQAYDEGVSRLEVPLEIMRGRDNEYLEEKCIPEPAEYLRSQQQKGQEKRKYVDDNSKNRPPH
jgi:hypothetical protein